MSAAGYAVGDRVVYWQPGVDAILAAWSGKAGGRRGGGEERTVTIAEARGGGYYVADDGTMLADSDIIRRG